ncbi:hypothetical protein LEP1GSC126_1365 [Leptospira kirschneri str. 200801774]|nr:hypothetical protein LEP1GSC126_1365 [Leptospira kirschneri str. 200801774]
MIQNFSGPSILPAKIREYNPGYTQFLRTFEYSSLIIQINKTAHCLF